MPRDRAFLVAVQLKRDRVLSIEERFEELTELTRSAGGETVGSVQAMLDRPTPNFFISKGKLEEIRVGVARTKANLVIFNVDLSPIQARNIERETGARSVDRTGLILDIFSRRARSHAGRLQVELAQLNYLLPRLVGQGVIMSRLGGGIGTRGPGEQKLEVDRRKIRDRITRLKRELERLRTHQGILRKGRKRKDFKIVAIIGYTNAGKSTLLNTLTGSDVFVEDKLFATLDTTTRVLKNSGHKQVLFTDTVGFLIDLPHTLIESFSATLEEVSEADTLLHVLDASHPRLESQYKSVLDVLDELKAVGKHTVLALNKVDLLDDATKNRVQQRFPSGIFISGTQKIGLRALVSEVLSVVRKDETNATHRAPH